MKQRLYSVHAKGERLEVVADRFSWGALLLAPLWLIWHGLWITLVLMAVLVAVAAFLLSVAAAVVVFVGLSLILAFEGGAVRRAELRLRGWREAGVVEAGSAAGAEESFLEATQP